MKINTLKSSNSLNTHTGYTVYFKKQGEGNEWYREKVLTNRAQINDLEAGTYYSFRVSADCNAFASELGATFDLQMPSPPPSQVQCGKELVVDLSNNNPIQSLKISDKVMAGDFEFTLTEVRPLGGGWFAGKAYTKMKLFQGARVYARFDRIKVNTDRRLIDGEMISTGAGVQVVPDEWKEQYLSFTNEINHLFDEINKGLDKLDAVMGKIDEVLKKIDQWLENYQGEDKAELLETIRIGKKEIEDGKKDIKDGKVGDGVKKLKDGSGKVIGVGAKMVKKALETLFKDLKELVKEVVAELRGKSKEKKAELTKKDEDNIKNYKAIRKEIVDAEIVVKDTVQLIVKVNDAPPSYFDIVKTAEADELKTSFEKLDVTFNLLRLENIKLEYLIRLIEKPEQLQGLINQVKKQLEALGEEILKGNTAELKEKIKKIVIVAINDAIKELSKKR